ncbi:MAG: A24 family peptidase, partial [Candidatus Micrarchaeota archaeon]|nr:A24 family peptidase [Candidatus Micrarchaeota archaeon]
MAFLDPLAFDAVVRAAVAVLFTAVLAWEDHQTSFMNEKILYAFAGLGLVWNVLFLSVDALLSAVGVCVLILAAGYLAYRSGSFGGGDVWLLAGLSLWLPVSPFVASFLPWPFVVSVFLTASILASIGASAWYAAILFRKKRFPGAAAPAFAIGALLLLAGVALLPVSFSAKAFFLLLGLSAWFYFLYRTDVTDHAVVEETPFSKILDEDILATEKLEALDIKRFGLERVLTESARVKLKKFMAAKKIRTVPIHRHLPRF